MGARENKVVEEILALGKGPLRLWHLKNGGMRMPNGVFYRFGMVPGASDILGEYSRVIKPEDVGKIIGQFGAIEVKDDIGKPTPKQLNFTEQVRLRGGFAGIARSAADARAIINYWDEDDQLCECGEDRPAPGYQFCPDCTSDMIGAA